MGTQGGGLGGLRDVRDPGNISARVAGLAKRGNSSVCLCLILTLPGNNHQSRAPHVWTVRLAGGSSGTAKPGSSLDASINPVTLHRHPQPGALSSAGWSAGLGCNPKILKLMQDCRDRLLPEPQFLTLNFGL